MTPTVFPAVPPFTGLVTFAKVTRKPPPCLPATNTNEVAVCGVVLAPCESEQPSWLKYVLFGLGVVAVLSKVGSHVGVIPLLWNGMSPRLVTVPFFL